MTTPAIRWRESDGNQPPSLPALAAPAAPAQLSGQTILCLATQEWDAHWTPVQQVMLRLAPQNRVIYFEPFHPPFAWLKRRNHVLKQQRHQGQPRLREVRPNLLVYSPSSRYLPFNMRSRLAHKVNSRSYECEIRSLLRSLGAARPWLWAFFAQSPSVLNLPFEHFIYDCVDYWPAFFPNPVEQRFVQRVDEVLCRRADLVFVGSNPLRERQRQFNPNTFVVPHAADVAHFMKAAVPDLAVPSDLDAIPHPRIGFVGMIDSVRFDTDIIRRLAANPAHHVVLVGGVNGGGASPLPDLPNVHWLGMKPIAELPAYLKGMDVCVMPYRLNEATRNIYPLKLHEYLATGKPVVSTAIDAVQSFRDLIYVADAADGFAELVAQALREKDEGLAQRRRASAQQHTWEAHVAIKSSLIRDHLSAREQ